MRTIIALLSVSLLLSGCGLTNKTNIYTDEESNISFTIPEGWEVKPDDRFSNAVGLQTNKSTYGYIYFDYNSESFEEHEKRRTSEYYGFSEELNLGADEIFPTKVYKGMDETNYIVEINGSYVRFNAESSLVQDQIDGINEILDSITF